jgi:hypothetical protein
MGTSSDPVVVFGYNHKPDYTLAQAGEPGVAWMLEGNYDDASGHNKAEGYLQYMWGDGSGKFNRVFGTQWDKVTNLPTGTFISGGPVNGVAISVQDGTGTPGTQQFVQGTDIATFNTSGIGLFYPVTTAFNQSYGAKTVDNVIMQDWSTNETTGRFHAYLYRSMGGSNAYFGLQAEEAGIAQRDLKLQPTGGNLIVGGSNAQSLQVQASTSLLGPVSSLINSTAGGADGAFGEVFRSQIAGNLGTGNWRHSIYSSVSGNPALSMLKFSLATGQTTQGDVLTLYGSGKIAITNFTGFAATIDPSSLTAARTFSLPDSGGTICLTVTCVTSVGGGTLTANALVAGGGSQSLQTPSATATLDSSGNISTPGGLTSGGASVAGSLTLRQGSSPSAGTSAISLYAPASVTSYKVALPGAAATGIPHWSNSAGTVTESISAVNLASTDVTGNLPLSAIATVPNNTVIGNISGSTAVPSALTALPASVMPNVPVSISSSGPVADPGGASDYLFNNAAGALTFNLPDGVAGLQRCYRNATGKSGVITIAVAASNAIDLNGANGATSTGTLVSGGALGDAVCLVSDAAHHWYAYPQKGTWTNN